MEGFRTTDVISLSYIAYILFALLFVLGGAYAILFFANKKIKTSLFAKTKEKNIAIIETKYVPKVGQICLISVSSNKYLIVNSASGIAISPVVDVIDTHSPICQTDVTN